MEARYLPVKLSQEEVALRSDKLARTCEERNVKVANVDSIKEEAKGRVKLLEADIQDLEDAIKTMAETVRTHHEKQEVECEWNRNEELVRMELVRTDTGEIVESRPMTIQERQKILFPVNKAEAG